MVNDNMTSSKPISLSINFELLVVLIFYKSASNHYVFLLFCRYYLGHDLLYTAFMYMYYLFSIF